MMRGETRCDAGIVYVERSRLGSGKSKALDFLGRVSLITITAPTKTSPALRNLITAAERIGPYPPDYRVAAQSNSCA